MNLKLPAALLSALTLAAPAAAQAATHAHRSSAHAVTGTVLSADGRSFELVGRSGAVRHYHVSGHLSGAVHRGARVSFTAAGARASRLRVVGHVRKVQFLARLGSTSGSAVALTLGDGGHLKLKGQTKKSRKHVRNHRKYRVGHVIAHMAGDVPPISIQGLQPGQTVLVTISLDPAGNELQIAIKLIDPATAGTSTGSDGGSVPAGDQHATGTVVSVDEDNGVVTVADASGNTTDYTLSDALLASDDSLPNECDIVDVAYHADPADATNLIADQVTTTGTDTTNGDCSSVDTGDDQEAIGSITAVDPVNGTITVLTQDAQTLSLSADPSLLDGLNIGDQVDVLYAQGDNGSLVADDISPVDSSSDSSGSDGTDGSGDGSGS
jgi:hypothetical protein